MLTHQELREKMRGASEVPSSIMECLHQEKLFQIWVPKKYGGLGLRLNEGLSILFDWSKIDGSLGWVLTLCSGANFFSRNLKPHIAEELFLNSPTCFGGSGMTSGTAEKQHNGTFLINGLWHFATGAPHLTHFTFNAKLTKNGNALLDESGNEMIRAFIIAKHQAEIIPNWNAMGMKATETYSFKVENVAVSEDYSFIYDEFFTDDVLDKIPFRICADVTLLVNYLGMAAHFAEESMKMRPQLNLEFFNKAIQNGMMQVMETVNEIEGLLKQSETITPEKQSIIHDEAANLVEHLSHQILQIYIQLGVKASDTNAPIYQVFCDYFTATQHVNFRKEWYDYKNPCPCLCENL